MTQNPEGGRIASCLLRCSVIPDQFTPSIGNRRLPTHDVVPTISGQFEGKQETLTAPPFKEIRSTDVSIETVGALFDRGKRSLVYGSVFYQQNMPV